MLFKPIKTKLVVDKRYSCVQSEWVHKSKKEEVHIYIYTYIFIVIVEIGL